MSNIDVCSRLMTVTFCVILLAGCVDGTVRVKLPMKDHREIPAAGTARYNVKIIEHTLSPNLYKIEIDIKGQDGYLYRYWDHAMRHSAQLAKSAGYSYFIFKNYTGTIIEKTRRGRYGGTINTYYGMKDLRVIVEFHNSPQGLVTLRYDVDRILAETAALPDPHSIKRHGQVTMPIAVPSPG